MLILILTLILIHILIFILILTYLSVRFSTDNKQETEKERNSRIINTVPLRSGGASSSSSGSKKQTVRESEKNKK